MSAHVNQLNEKNMLASLICWSEFPGCRATARAIILLDNNMRMSRRRDLSPGRALVRFQELFNSFNDHLAYCALL